VLPNDLVVTDGKKVAAEYIDATAIEQGAGQPPLRHAIVIRDHEMTAIAPVRVRHRVEHFRERGRDRNTPVEPTATELGSTGGVENAIVGEQAHQPVDVVTVPCIGVSNEQTFEFVAIHIEPPRVEIEAWYDPPRSQQR